MQLFTLGITWLSKWIISARTRIFYILIDERSEAAVNVACLPDGRTPILLFFWWADHHTVEREIFLDFSKKDKTSKSSSDLSTGLFCHIYQLSKINLNLKDLLFQSSNQNDLSVSNHFCNNWYSMVEFGRSEKVVLWEGHKYCVFLIRSKL